MMEANTGGSLAVAHSIKAEKPSAAGLAIKRLRHIADKSEAVTECLSAKLAPVLTEGTPGGDEPADKSQQLPPLFAEIMIHLERINESLEKLDRVSGRVAL